MLSDFTYAARSLWRRPSFALAATLILAVAIAANAAVFSVANALFLRPLPYPDADRLVALRSTHRGGDTSGAGAASARDLADWQQQAKSFEAIAGYRWRAVDLRSTNGLPSQRLRGLYVTPEYFDVFGITHVQGRVFNTSDRGTNAIVLGRGLWQERFGSDPREIGSVLDVNMINLARSGATPNVVVGAALADAHFPPLTSDFNLGEGNEDDTIEFWLPEFPPTERRDGRSLDVVAKLRPGVTVQQAQAEMNAIARRLGSDFPDTNQGWGVDVVPLRAHMVGTARRVVVLLSLGAALVLLIACGNVATLYLVRGLARRNELAVRSALGAGRARLTRHLLAESALVALIATGLGGIGSLVAVHLLAPWFPAGIPLVKQLNVDRTVLAYLIAAAVVTTLVTGAAPAWIVTAQPFSAAGLNLRGSTPGRWHDRAVSALVALQAALTIVLLISTGLLLRSAHRLWKVDPGFNAADVLTMTISLPMNKFDWQHNVAFEREVTAAVRALPGVKNAAAIQGVPMRVGGFWTSFAAEGMPPAPIQNHPVAHLRVVSADYFRTLQIPLLEGRDFDTRDDAAPRGHPRFVIINRALAARYWPGQDAVGRRLREDFNPEWVTVAGVVGDVRYASLDAPPDLEIYLPDGIFPESAMTLLVKSASGSQPTMAAVRDRIRSIDSEAFVSDVHTMDELVSASLAGRSFATLLLTVCAGVALLLALSGIYGVIAQAAANRRMEIGIRLALGATEGSVVRWMLRLAMQPVAIGVVVGGLASMALTRLLTTLLYGIAPFDAATVAATVMIFGAVGATAAFLPARRAAKTDPLTVLHAE